MIADVIQILEAFYVFKNCIHLYLDEVFKKMHLKISAKVLSLNINWTN